LPALRASSALGQHRSESTGQAFPSGYDTRKIPNFDKYKSKSSEMDNRVFQYVMAGTLGAVTAMGAKATVVGMYIIIFR
jgi:ubiquinol-cytochrome c reductase iron-sulfur subunit